MLGVQLIGGVEVKLEKKNESLVSAPIFSICRHWKFIYFFNKIFKILDGEVPLRARASLQKSPLAHANNEIRQETGERGQEHRSAQPAKAESNWRSKYAEQRSYVTPNPNTSPWFPKKTRNTKKAAAKPASRHNSCSDGSARCSALIIFNLITLILLAGIRTGAFYSIERNLEM